MTKGQGVAQNEVPKAHGERKLSDMTVVILFGGTGLKWPD